MKESVLMQIRETRRVSDVPQMPAYRETGTA